MGKPSDLRRAARRADLQPPVSQAPESEPTPVLRENCKPFPSIREIMEICFPDPDWDVTAKEFKILNDPEQVQSFTCMDTQDCCCLYDPGFFCRRCACCYQRKMLKQRPRPSYGYDYTDDSGESLDAPTPSKEEDFFGGYNIPVSPTGKTVNGHPVVKDNYGTSYINGWPADLFEDWDESTGETTTGPEDWEEQYRDWAEDPDRALDFL